MKPIKVIVIKRICSHYTAPLLQKLARLNNLDLSLYYGSSRNIKYRRLQNADNITGFKAKQLLTLSLTFELQKRLLFVCLNPTLLFYLFKDKPDVIICEGESNLPNNVFITLFAKLTHTPYIWWGLGRIRSNKPSIFRKLFGPLIKYMLRNAAGVLAYSTFAKEFYSSYGVDKRKIFVAYNCVDTEKAKKDITKFKPLVQQKRRELGLSNKKVILFVGSFTKEKKIENLILAYQLTKAHCSNIALLLVGDGETRQVIESLVKEKRLKDVVFVGKKIEDVSLYFLLGDIFVLPGEGGLAINQAMVHGLPIITVSADGTELDMVIPEEDGYIVENNNVNALVGAILTIINDNDLRERMGKKSKKLVEQRFNIRTMINVIISCIDFVVRSRS